jgi:hypothetical protein
MAFIKNKYTKAEMILLSLLPKGGRHVSSVELCNRYYDRHPPRPNAAMQSISKMMSLLIDKYNRNKEPFRIVKAKRSGPYPMEYRMEYR